MRESSNEIETGLLMLNDQTKNVFTEMADNECATSLHRFRRAKPREL